MRLPTVIAFLTLASSAMAEVPNVVTDIAPVHSLVAQVMGKLGEPILLLDQGSDPHHFQMRPSQARALANADLIFWVGDELTPWLDRAIEGGASHDHAIALLETPETRVRQFDEDHSEGADHNHHGHDPHAWLDTQNAALWLGVIAQKLSAADPANAETYAANAGIARAEIDDITSYLYATLTPVKELPIVVLHDAYGYFADQFGLTIVGAVREGDATAPGAAHLNALQTLIDSGSVACVFREPQHSAAMLEAIVADSQIHIGTLDPSGAMIEPGPGFYNALMTGLANEISRCAIDD